MGKYIFRRVLQAIPLLMIVTVLVFFLLKAAGDPLAYLAQDPRITERDRALLRARYGLDDPLPLQFIHWLIGDDWYLRVTEISFVDNRTRQQVTETIEQYGTRQGIIRGDFGESLRFQRPVTEVIAMRLPPTLILMGTAYTVTIIFALSIGIFAALRQYSFADNTITALSFVFYSMPVFLTALILVQIFAVQLRWLPVQGMFNARNPNREFTDLLRHLILPVASLASISIAGYSRYIRSTMLEVINSDYIRTARAKGLSERRVTFIHALKNASLPLVTLIGLDIPFLLGGAVITETIFSWPGMGFMFIEALNFLDAPLLVAFVLMTAVAVVIFQLLTDIVYSLLDPRIRFD